MLVNPAVLMQDNQAAPTPVTVVLTRMDLLVATFAVRDMQ